MVIRLMTAIVAVVVSVLSASAFAATGRTAGTFAVSPRGSAQYTIPIWAPPGPRGIQPNLSLLYDSNSPSGYLGVGWSLQGLGAITRCNKTFAQDTTPAPVALVAADGYCINGNRLRLTSGTYGTAGSVYQTEIADFSQITANGTAGGGPQYFTVQGRNGLTYQYGYTDANGYGANSEVLASGTNTALAWLLSKVIDRAGNSMAINYVAGTSTAVPGTIYWTSSSPGSASYNYKINFTYTTNNPQTSIYGYVAGAPLTNVNLLTNVSVTSQGTTVRNYVLTYQTSPTTGRNELKQVQECADSGATNCLSPTTISYQSGAVGFSTTATSGLSAVSGFLVTNYDFNGDGYMDLAYYNGTTWNVAFGSASGYGTPVNTGITVSSALFGDLQGTGHDEILAQSGSTWYSYMWNGSSSSFVGTSTGIAYSSSAALVDVDGDGLPDLVTLSWTKGQPGTVQVYTRLNTSTASGVSFSSTLNNAYVDHPYFDQATLMSPSAGGVGGVLRAWDFDGDGRGDLALWVSDSGIPTVYGLLSRGTTFAKFGLPSGGTAGLPQFLNWNDDACTDYIWGGYLYIAACNGTAGSQFPVPSGLLAVADFNGDGRTDLIVNSNGTIGAYLSTGTNLSGLVLSTIPYNAQCAYFTLDANADGLDDLGCWNQATPYPVYYYPHNGTGVKPDLATSFTDGYGNSASPTYAPITQSNYTAYPYASPVYPLENFLVPLYVVNKATFSDPSNAPSGTFFQTFTYSGAWTDVQGRGFSNFIMLQKWDSRSGFWDTFFHGHSFPWAGILNGHVLSQDQAQNKPIRQWWVNNETFITLDGTAYNQRYFPYYGILDAFEYELGGSEDTKLMSTAITNYTYDNYGNATNVSTTVTDNDPGSPYPNEQWTSTTTNTMAPNTATWCLNLPTQTTVTSSNTSAGGGAITRTVSYPSPDYTYCRQDQQVVEPSSATYKVTTAYGYDGFGNLNSSIVTGVGMAARTTGLNWGTTGQFLTTVTNPLSQTTTFGYDPNSGMLTSVKDPNTLTTSWQYDNFARKTKESRPDSTATTWAYNNCATAGCVNSNNKMTVVQTRLNADGTTLRVDNAYLDALDRTLVTSAEMPNGAFNRIETQFDSLGNVHLQGAPCMFTSCTQYWTTNTYDALHRLIESQRPISATNSTLQSTIYGYAGRTLTVTDPQLKVTKTISHVTGGVGRTIDHNGYYVNTNLDAFGSVASVTDSLSNTLKTATYKYGVAPFVVSATDMDLGNWSYTVDALGEVTNYTDADGKSFSALYDALSRPTQRIEPDMTTTWTWGNTAASHNIGQLASINSNTGSLNYTENYGFDSFGRLSSKQFVLPVQGTYQFAYAYDSNTGLLQSAFFPFSYPANYRVEVAYSYQYGILSQLSNAGNPSTIWWQATATNPRGQITQENTGDSSTWPRIVSNHTYDAVTGWLTTIQTGVTTGAALQNQSYLYDEMGNVQQRQDNNAGLTENFYYDNLYRLDHSVLGSTTNLQMGYDAMGNITSRSDVAAGATWTYDPTHKHQVTQAGSSSFTYAYDANGNVKTRNGTALTWTSYNYPSDVATSTEGASFDYGPNRQRWRMTYTSSAGPETTYYASPAFEIVATASGTDYRHYISANGRPVVVISHTSGGSASVRSLLTDHQGSISEIVQDQGPAPYAYAKESFSAFGNRREASTWTGVPTSGELTSMNGVTREGYTFQTVLGSMGLNHMNGRVQDAVTGRFLSADPNVQDPGNTQSFNRYSYVNNNPLSQIDPTGFVLLQVDGGSASDYLDEIKVTASRDTLGPYDFGLADTLNSVQQQYAPSLNPLPLDEIVVVGHKKPPPTPVNSAPNSLLFSPSSPSTGAGARFWAQSSESKIMKSMCADPPENAANQLTDFMANFGSAADSGHPLIQAGAVAAAAGSRSPVLQGASIIGPEVANGLSRLGVVGNFAAGVGVLVDLRKGDIGSAIYDSLDFGVYYGLTDLAVASAIPTAGAGTVVFGSSMLLYGNAGGSRTFVQRLLCNK